MASAWFQLRQLPHRIRGFFFFQAEDGIRDVAVTGVQTCALPIYPSPAADANSHLLSSNLSAISGGEVENKMKESRRKFLKASACGLTGAAMIASLDKFNLVNAMTQDQQSDIAADYRALVCIFLSGGTDGNNMVIPFDGYTNAAGGTTNGYDNVRTGSGLAVPKSALTNTKISPSNTGGVAYAFHPNLSPEANNVGQGKGLLDIWNAGKLAVLCNVGSLVQPITRAQYASGIGHPYQLFSHSDQVNQQQSSIANTTGQTGWGGRIADKTNALNGAVALPMNISLAGTSLFSTGFNSRQLSVAPAPTTLANLLNLSWNGPAGANPFTA